MRTGIKFSSGIKAVIVYYSWCPTSLPEGGALTYGMRRSGPFKSMRFAAYRHFEKVEKVTGKVSLSHHLLEFVICKPVSDTSLASLVRETHPEGGIYSFLRSRRNSRKCDSFGRGRTGYCAFHVFWMVFIAVTPLEGVGLMQ